MTNDKDAGEEQPSDEHEATPMDRLAEFVHRILAVPKAEVEKMVRAAHKRPRHKQTD
jgi:hypothetical protein